MAMAIGDGEDGVDDLKFWAFCIGLWRWLFAMAIFHIENF